MYKTIGFEIKGLAPLMTKNGQTCDPLNEHAKAMKEISKKRVKTEEDYEALSRLDWFGALYLNDDGRPCIPGENIEAMFISAAKKSKQGPQAKAGILSDGLWPIIYAGPKDMDALYDTRKFIDRRSVKVSQSRVMRTRPIWREWSLKFEVSYMADIFNKSEVVALLKVAGEIICLGDYRPKFGRFEIA